MNSSSALTARSAACLDWQVVGLSLWMWHVICFGLIVSLGAHASEVSVIEEMSLEQLVAMPFSTGSEPKRNATFAAGSVYRLTQDDIRRSGAVSLPQALRLVPGLQVAQIDGSRWAISARGFNSRMSNRTLVLIDGRSLYTPLTGGMFWDMQDTMIEEIDRIEVQLGPGGATWGSNAFSAVINVITKRAAQTGGLVVSTEADGDDGDMAAMRFGRADGALRWRLFGKYSEGGSNENQRGESINDDWQQMRVGGRSEIDLSDASELQLNFEAYRGTQGATVYDPNEMVLRTTYPYSGVRELDIEENTRGGFIGGRFVHELADDARLNVDASLQYYDLDSMLMNEHGTNGELNIQHLLAPLGVHDLTWGVMGRAARDAASDDAEWRISPTEISSWRAGFFIQDQLSFFDERLLITAGAKYEYSDLTGSDVMPSLLASYAYDNGLTVWGRVSRGVRAPALTEQYGRLGGVQPNAPLTPTNPLPRPIVAELWGDENMDTEKVTAFEVGARQTFTPQLSADLSAYYNKYAGLRGIGEMLPVTCQPSGIPVAANPLCLFVSPYVLAPLVLTNVFDTDGYGGELIVTYAPRPNWKLIGSYSHISFERHRTHVRLATDNSDYDGFEAFVGGYDPKHQLGLRSAWSIGRAWDVDLQLRYVDELPRLRVPAYTELNLRAAWRPTQHFELALRGSNLLHDSHHEYASDFNELRPAWIERRISLQGRWAY